MHNVATDIFSGAVEFNVQAILLDNFSLNDLINSLKFDDCSM